MEELQKELRQQFRQQQEKYVYYVIALCVTAVAFSIHETMDKSLTWSQIPLAIAILLWCMSTFCGLRFIAYVISTLSANNAYFEILQGKDEKIGSHPQKIEAASRGVKKAMQLNSETAFKFGTWQNRGFYFGSIAFISWHILEMYKKTL